MSSWRTTGIVQDIGEILKSFDYLIINHIRRKGNRATDFLANWGSNDQLGKADSKWYNETEKPKWKELVIIINQDHETATNQFECI